MLYTAELMVAMWSFSARKGLGKRAKVQRNR